MKVSFKSSFIALATACTFISAASAQSTVTVTHGPVPAPTYIDLGAPGDSVGDQRIWEFEAQSTGQKKVVTDWVMTTTSHGRLPGIEKRLTVAVFSFGEDAKDTILLQGIGIYPMAGSTLKTEAALQRAVIGGTGKYAGAAGTVTSTHFENNTWQHVFNLK